MANGTTTRLVDRLSQRVGNRVSRRGFFARTALAGTALAVVPADYILRPGDAYAAICNCNGSSCDCGSLCCDGYTEFCCTLYGGNQCPPGTRLGGWWKADGSGLCGSGPRYYMDCNADCGGCGCGGNGICSGACTGTPCGCAGGSCGNRKSGCTQFRYGQCNQAVACLGPIVCRVVTCLPPWQIDSSCTTTVLVDQKTAFHDRPCLHRTVGSLDSVTDAGSGLRVRGWALDFDTADPVTVHVYVDGGFGASLVANQARPDIAAAYPGMGPAHGFDAVVPAGPGGHTVDVYAISVGPEGPVNPLIGSGVVTVSSPFGNLEAVVPGFNKVTLGGWVVDPDTAASVDVHVYVDGVGAAVLTADRPRPDIAAAFPGKGPNHGFDLTIPLSPGPHSVQVFGINVGPGSNSLIGSRAVTINANPIGSLDVAAPVVGGVRVRGWALDPDTSAPIRVGVWADGKPAADLVANQARPDVGAAFPAAGSNHGYDATVPLPPGVHTIDVYGVNVGAGDANPLLGRRVLQVGGVPLGAVDIVRAGPDVATVIGWALDLDTVDPITVHVYVDGVGKAIALADRPRPDLLAVFPYHGANHGFDITVPVDPGSRTVSVYAINTGSGASNPLVGSRGVAIGGDPLGALDDVVAGAGKVRVRGWALDRDTAAPIQVHVYVDGRGAAILTADASRPDVAAAYPGWGASHGFDAEVGVSAGTHRIDVFAINTGAGTGNPLIGNRTVVV